MYFDSSYYTLETVLHTPRILHVDLGPNYSHFLHLLFTDFYREIMEEKVDSACVKCPYFLEHCIMTVLKLVSLISQTAETRKGDTSSNSTQDAALRTDKESSAFTPYRDPSKTSIFPAKSEVQGPWAQIPWGAGQASPLVLTPSAMHSGLQSVWLSLRLIRGVPSSLLNGLADRLGAGVIGILR